MRLAPDGLLALSAAAGHAAIVDALLAVSPADALPLAHAAARSRGHARVAEAIAAASEAAGAAGLTQPAAPPRGWPPLLDATHDPLLVVIDAADLERDPTLARRILGGDGAPPRAALVRGLARPWADQLGGASVDALRAAWGDRTVSVTFSPDELYQRGVTHPTHGRALLAAHEETRTFGAFLDLAATHGAADYVSVSQCEQALADFGLPAAPPIIAEQLGLDPTATRSNLWATPAPKVSVLHHDTDDSMLLQFSGTKRFTVVAPCAHGMGVAPCAQRVERRRRVAPGIYEAEASDDVSVNFPLLNISAYACGDVDDFPLLRPERAFAVDVREGDALLLPAYWHHQVNSTAAPGKLNVAANYWFEAPGNSLDRRLLSVLAGPLGIDFT